MIANPCSAEFLDNCYQVCHTLRPLVPLGNMHTSEAAHVQPYQATGRRLVAAMPLPSAPFLAAAAPLARCLSSHTSYFRYQRGLHALWLATRISSRVVPVTRAASTTGTRHLHPDWRCLMPGPTQHKVCACTSCKGQGGGNLPTHPFCVLRYSSLRSLLCCDQHHQTLLCNTASRTSIITHRPTTEHVT